jgi:RNA polymerase sigma factor for flagellar operon FliA
MPRRRFPKLTRASHNPCRDVAARNRLVLEHLFLPRRVALRLCRVFPRWVDADELISEGVAALIGAAVRHDPLRRVPFARYATRRIRGAMLEAIERRLRGPETLGSRCNFPVEDPRLARVDSRCDAHALLVRVGCARRRVVLRMYFLDQMTMKRIARRLGITEARVSQLVKESLCGLRRRVIEGESDCAGAKNNPADGEPAGCCISPLIRQITGRTR